MRPLLLFAGLLAVASPAPAQRIQKGDSVYLRVPWFGLLQDTRQKFTYQQWWGEVRATDAGITINDSLGWRTKGLPTWRKLKVTNWKVDNKKGTLKVQIKGPGSFDDAEILIYGDTTALLPEIFATDATLEAARVRSDSALDPVLFHGRLAGIAWPVKRRLIRVLEITGAGAAYERFKELDYLVVDLGVADATYNTLQVKSPAARVAEELSSSLFTLVKGFARILAEAPEVEGIGIRLDIRSRPALPANSRTETEKMVLYAPAALIRQFQDQDITAQQFIDGCFVIVDGNRIAVPLG